MTTGIERKTLFDGVHRMDWMQAWASHGRGWPSFTVLLYLQDPEDLGNVKYSMLE